MSTDMRLCVLASIATLSCGGGGSPASMPAHTGDDPAQPHAEPEPTPTPVEPTVENWDPDKPVDPRSLPLRTMFVVVDKSAVCPTRKQASARECGNSVEDITKGQREPLGSSVNIVGDEAIGGMYKALRFQKAGVLPGWIIAEDVAAKPRTDALDAFDARADVAEAKEVSKLGASELAKLPKGTAVKWTRTKTVKFGQMGAGTFIYTDLAAIGLPSPSVDDSYPNHHDCLIYGDCLQLAYICSDEYCDEVSILARATGNKVPPPDDPEGEWTGPKTDLALFEVIHLADRFGGFPKK